MTWTARQIAMLAEMGLQVPVASRRAAVASPVASTPAAAPSDAPVAVLDAPVVTIEQRIEPASIEPRVEQQIKPAPVPRPVDIKTPSTRPQRAEYAALGWTELRETVAGCTACALCQGRTQTVFGVGSQTADWMVVGEAPGEPEDLRGEPFVDKSGQLLDNMLAALGLSRSEGNDDMGATGETPSPASRAYITNAVKCRPPGSRNPMPAELATCEPYLMRQIELLKPKIIIAMGPMAVRQLLQTDEPIGRLRGRVHRYHDVPLIVTYHPAYLLRNHLDDKARVWDDLCLARDTLSGPAA